MPGQPVRSATGVTLTRDQQLSSLRAENTARRWAAVIPDSDGVGTVYLLPRGNVLPLNAMSTLLAAIDPTLTATNVREQIYYGESAEVLGAMGRVLPILPVLALKQPQGLKDIPPDPSPQMAVFRRLNALDYAHLMVEGVRNISSALLPKCIEPLLKSEGFQTAYTKLLEGLASEDPAAAEYCTGSRPIYLGTTRCPDCSALSCYEKWEAKTGG